MFDDSVHSKLQACRLVGGYGRIISFPGKAGLKPAFRAAAGAFDEFFMHHAVISIRLIFELFISG